MGVNVTHFIFETLGDADYQIVDEGFHGAQGGDILPRTVVHFDNDGVLVGV